MRPPARWLSAATHCSRPPSKLCVGSACVPGGSARSPPPPSFCSTTSMAEPHDHRPDVAATGNGSLGGGEYSLGAGLRYVAQNASLYMTDFSVAGGPTSVPYPGAWDGSMWTLFYEVLCYAAVGLLV